MYHLHSTILSVINDQVAQGSPMLFHAIFKEIPDMIKMLLDNGADINNQDRQVRSFLSIA